MRLLIIMVFLTMTLSGCNSSVDAVNQDNPSGRVLNGLLVLYEFDSTTGIYEDTSQIDPSLPLTPTDSSLVSELGPGILVTGANKLYTRNLANKVTDNIMQSNALTVEAWIKPYATTQAGPARIVTLSADASINRNITLGQEGDQFIVRMKTSADPNNIPEFSSPAGIVTTKLTHVVFTWDTSTEMARLYINGQLYTSSDTVFTGDLSVWQPYKLMMANEYTYGRPWLGAFFLVALYNRALSGDEVLQNYNQPQ